MEVYTPSPTPEEDIGAIAYPEQRPELRQYKAGYGGYFGELPILSDHDRFLWEKQIYAKSVLDRLGEQLKKDAWILDQSTMPEGGFDRTILALEKPTVVTKDFLNHETELKEGAEIIVARWADGYTSPVHGHSDGFLYENILSGSMLVNNYRVIDHEKRIARLIETQIVKNGTFVSSYAKRSSHKRGNLVHNFTSVGYSTSLHFVPEHTRDGRDNTFNVEHFEDNYILMPEDFEPITAQQGMYSKIGDVILVRSSNVPYFGDHYIIITGHPVMKEHGLRPQDVAIKAKSNNTELLNYMDSGNGLTLLRMNEKMRERFFNFHKIDMKDNKIVLPY